MPPSVPPSAVAAMWAFASPPVPPALAGASLRGVSLTQRRACPLPPPPAGRRRVPLRAATSPPPPPPPKKSGGGSSDDGALDAAIAAAAAAREAADRDRNARAVAAEFATPPATPGDGSSSSSSSPPPPSPVDEDMGGLRERLELLSTRERDWEGVKDQLADLERMSGLRLSDGAGEPTAAAWVFCAVCVALPVYLAWVAYSGLADSAASLTGTTPLL